LGALYKGKPDKVKKSRTFTGRKAFSAITADIKPLAGARGHTSVCLAGNTAL